MGLLLSGVALLLFGCWGIYALVTSERELAASAGANLRAATETATKIGVVAGDVEATISQTRPQITSILGHANGTLVGLDKTADELDKAAAGLNDALAEVNAPCGEGKPCGTLADVNRTLGSIRLASGQVTAVSLHEQEQLDLANQQETAIAQATQADLAKLGGAIDGVTALAANADMKASFEHLNTTTGAVAGMATDTEQYWHGMLHPKWPRRVWGFVEGVGLDVGKILVP